MKNLKINIKNSQLAEALNIDSLLEKKKGSAASRKTKKKTTDTKEEPKKPKARIVSAPKETEALPLEEEKEVVEEQAVSSPDTLETPEATLDTSPTAPLEEKLEKVPPPAEKEAKEEKTEEEKSGRKKVEALEEPAPPKKGVFRDTLKKKGVFKTFDSRDRQGLRDHEEDQWRKKRTSKSAKKASISEEEIIRPKFLKIRIPITIKDLAQEMKLKASQLISKLFMQGIVLTLNDYLEDETTIQLLGHEFGCDITLDTSEEEKLRITDKTIAEEIQQTPPEKLQPRPPIIAFMGHVDHGKTSLIDAIRHSNLAAQEAGAITQHIGAFKTQASSGDITILDTPGHEAFFHMRERGANVTDLAILVVAGDEGMREQTVEALNQAKEAKVPILVAINKADKAGFDDQKVYRQLSEQGLLPECWGGTTITVNCSALTKKGIPELLEMISLQAEILELKANPEERARGTVLESEMHKGRGAVATVLVQNGTLKKGDALVLGHHWGRVKTMHDEKEHPLEEASPSTPVKITGLSGMVEAGAEFIAVNSEKEAKELAEARDIGRKHQAQLAKKMTSLENLFKEKASEQKILPLLLKADVQGSLEALKQSLLKLPMKKVRLEVIFEGVGEISESDIELASASKAMILGFHTQIESRAEPLCKQKGVTVQIHNIIYHAVEAIRQKMMEQLDKIAEEKEAGAAIVKATFKSSHLGVIAGCQVTEGSISRNHWVRVLRGKEVVWKGKIASLKRVKEDVREVQKGTECGILLEGYHQVQVGDIIQAYEITYHAQTLE